MTEHGPLIKCSRCSKVLSKTQSNGLTEARFCPNYTVSPNIGGSPDVELSYPSDLYR